MMVEKPNLFIINDDSEVRPVDEMKKQQQKKSFAIAKQENQPELCMSVFRFGHRVVISVRWAFGSFSHAAQTTAKQ